MAMSESLLAPGIAIFVASGVISTWSWSYGTATNLLPMPKKAPTETIAMTILLSSFVIKSSTLPNFLVLIVITADPISYADPQPASQLHRSHRAEGNATARTQEEIEHELDLLGG